MSLHNIQNNFSTTLSTNITTISQTTMTITATPTTPIPYYLTIGNDPLANPSICEIVEVTANVAGILTITRAQQGTTVQTFSSGIKVQMLATAGHFNEIYFGINSSQMFPQNNVVNLDGLTIGDFTLTRTPVLLGTIKLA